MVEELARHKEALKVAIGALRELGLDYAHFTETVEKRVAAVLEPAPDFEEVEESGGWVNIYPSSAGCATVKHRVTHAYPTESMADESAGTDRICCQELRVKVRRPVKRKVVREVVRENVSITDQGEIYGNATFWKHAECHGKTVTLIARWTE